MADIIKLLPDSVANQIAAGEVVQRPASVVKELLENSVDAGATEISLNVIDAGRTLLQVIDNGCGMSTTDARLSFERHATSKISKAQDLFQIRSKGFRGEALASIAAVAHVALKTKRREDELGTYIINEGSKVTTQEPVSCANGTSFSVKNLFYNIPARRNFLKSNNVEWKHILEEFERVALTHPEVGFELTHNAEQIFKLPISNLKLRILNLFGDKYNNRLVPIDESTSIVTLKGYIGKPEYAKKKRGEQFFFVNNRFIKNNYLHHAINSAFHQLIEKNYHPSYFIYMDIDPSRIDVNIHPTKTEIKFDDEKAIYSILTSAVRQAIGKHNIAPSIDFEQETSFNVLPPKAHQEVKAPNIRVNKNYNPFSEIKQTQNTDFTFDEFDSEEESELIFHKEDEQQAITFESKSENQELSDSNTKLFQLHQRYIVSQIKSGVIIVDQRQAHKRILFEKILKRLNRQSTVSQQLIFPLTIELSATDIVMLKEIWDSLRTLGFDIEQFGKNSVVVNGVPYEVGTENCDVLFKEIIHQAKQNSNNINQKFNEIAAKTLANNDAVSKNKKLTFDEMEHLLSELFACENPYYTPNGKPTLKQFTTEDLNKMFD